LFVNLVSFAQKKHLFIFSYNVYVTQLRLKLNKLCSKYWLFSYEWCSNL